MAKKDPKEKAPKEEKNENKAMKVDKKVIKETEKLMKEFMKSFDIDAEVSVSPGGYTNVEGEEEEFVEINIDGEEIGVLIGYLGRNLRSLQRIVNLLLNRRLGVGSGESTYVRAVIDVSGYRDKREVSLQKMADQIRDEVLASGESEDMPPMNSFERRVIHTHLQEFEDVTTESFGEGRDRYVRVFPVGGSDEDDSEDGVSEEDESDTEE